ncbi:hypothetical protein BT69DRAFT_1283799 [Atractiella rhizophila]|nr:hypothetical protein BT69DRAFT_1283799 [Atractiella rhizophila]
MSGSGGGRSSNGCSSRSNSGFGRGGDFGGQGSGYGSRDGQQRGVTEIERKEDTHRVDSVVEQGLGSRVDMGDERAWSVSVRVNKMGQICL